MSFISIGTLGRGFGRLGFRAPFGAGFSPADLFANDEDGAWYDPSDLSTVWQDAAGTTPAGEDAPVGRIDDKSGNGNHATQGTDAARPVLRSSDAKWWTEGDGVDDELGSAQTMDLSSPDEFWASVAVALNEANNVDVAATRSSSNIGVRIRIIRNRVALQPTDGQGAVDVDLSPVIGGTPTIITARARKSTRTVTAWQDGELKGESEAATGEGWFSGDHQILLHALRAGVNNSESDIYHAVLVAGVVSDANRAALIAHQQERLP